MALERLSLKTGELVWFIGDDAKKDIAGAKSALGALTLQKRHEGVVVSNQADAVFDDFREVRDALRKAV